MGLGDHARRQLLGVLCGCMVQRRAQVARPIRRGKAAVMPDHAALEPLLPVEGEQLHRHRVEQFIADDDAFKGFRQSAQPFDLVAPWRQTLGLAPPQTAGQINDAIALDTLAQGFKQLRCQRAGASAEFPDLGRASLRQSLPDLRRQRAAEQGRQLGRSDKVRARLRHQPEFLQLVAVIAQPRRIQRQRHETVERQPASRLVNGLAYQYSQLLIHCADCSVCKARHKSSQAPAFSLGCLSR